MWSLTSQRQRWYIALAVGSLFWTTAEAVAQRDVEPTEVRRARQLIEFEKETILFFAHPTTKFQSARFDGAKAVRDGYSITYTFNWTSAFDNDGYSELTFECDRNGKLDFIRIGESSAPLFKPFSASNMVVNFLKRELQKDPKLQEDRALMKLLDKDAKAILETYLRRDMAALMTVMKSLMRGDSPSTTGGGGPARPSNYEPPRTPTYPIRTDKYVRGRDDKLLPAPGYKWVSSTNDDLRTVWSPGQEHRDHSNVLSDEKEGSWAPATGYKWLTDKPGDLRVVKE